jgi:hypothetical protein
MFGEQMLVTTRVNGLVDKLINSLDTDRVIEIFARPKNKSGLNSY